MDRAGGAGRKLRYKGGVNPLHREATNSYVGPSFIIQALTASFGECVVAGGYNLLWLQ